MTRREPTAAELAADVLSRCGFTADDVREGIAEGGSISAIVTSGPVLSGICEAGIDNMHRLCRKALCSCECHGARS